MSSNSKKRTLAKVTMALAIMYVSISTAQALTDEPVETVLFSDVEIGDEHYTAIKYLQDNDLIHGYDDGTFKPYNEINRAEALKVLMGAVPNQKGTEEKTDFYFKDVSPTEWYFTHIRDAWINDIVDGYPDGLFHPEQTINRAESLKIVLLQEGADIPMEVYEPPYTDVPVDAWFAPYTLISKDRTLFIENRSDGGMNPEQNMNRGEFAELIYRLLKSKEGKVFVRTTWYGREGVNWGTASGEKFDTYAMTAAHKTIPFDTVLLVTNLANGEQVEVRINDRGPYPTGIDLDLTSGAFEEIASLGAGIINTEFEIIPEETTNEVEYGF